MNEESLFAAALEKRDPAERQAFLDEACAGDAGLCRRLERLLAADRHDSGILERGPDADALDAAPAAPPCSTPTKKGSSTATSSRRTSSSPPTTASRCPR